jgi:heavy metal sensor kinase
MTTTVMQNHEPWRVRVERHSTADGAFMILVAAAETPLLRERRVLARALMVAMPAAVVFAALVCWWVASRALRPLTRMGEEAERTTMHSLGSGLSNIGADDEIGQLGRAFNHLLHRVSVAVDSQRHFMADASHELRTPISAARTAAEVTLAQPHRSEEEYRDALDVVRAQTQRLGRMVDDMLVLARADAGGYRLRLTNCFADEAIAECVEAAAVLARAKGVAFDVDLMPSVPLVADDALVQQLTLNLLENAIKHTPSGGRIRLTVTRDAGHALIVVSDTGCGIADLDRERIFERFVRLDEARDTMSGAGLGLPIARWITECHGGTVSLEHSSPSGSTFVVRLPVGRGPFDSSDRLVFSSTPTVVTDPI